MWFALGGEGAAGQGSESETGGDGAGRKENRHVGLDSADAPRV